MTILEKEYNAFEKSLEEAYENSIKEIEVTNDNLDDAIDKLKLTEKEMQERLDYLEKTGKNRL